MSLETFTSCLLALWVFRVVDIIAIGMSQHKERADREKQEKEEARKVFTIIKSVDDVPEFLKEVLKDLERKEDDK